MLFRSTIVFFFISISFMLVSCGNDKPVQQDNSRKKISADTLISYNKGAARSEEQEIEDFISRYGWDMKKTPTGLRYMIYSHGTGPAAKKEEIASFRYKVRLLNGDLLYSSDKDGMREFRIGHGGVESGLEEGILLLHLGDKGKFIVPSHLAFGLLGDQNKVPPGATLVYDIELVKLK